MTFNASATVTYGPAIVEFQWDFGDGVTGTGKLTGHSYTSPGIYRVVLSLLTEQGSFTMSKAIVVMIEGDVNRDCRVDIVDIALVAAAYGSSPADPEWSPGSDINYDAAVNILDVAIAALNFARNCS